MALETVKELCVVALLVIDSQASEYVAGDDCVEFVADTVD